MQNGYGASQYATLLANDGARHVIDNTICLGTANSVDCSNHISSELNGVSDLLMKQRLILLMMWCLMQMMQQHRRVDLMLFIPITFKMAQIP